MNEHCRTYQEQIPLLLISRLEFAQSALLREHLISCSECQTMFQEETELMKLAMTEEGAAMLADHPEPAELSQFVFETREVEAIRRLEIDDHLSQCNSCSDVVSKLRILPLNLDELVSPDITRVLSALSLTKGIPTPVTAQPIARVLKWKSITSYAVAATILLVGILGVSSLLRSPSTSLDIRIQAVSRGSEDTLVFKSSTPSTIVNLSYFLSPEPGHNYGFELVETTSGTVIWAERNYRDFDEQGFVRLKLPMDTGYFRFEITDASPADTLTYQREFRIHLADQ